MSSQVIYRYVRWKGLLFGAMPVALGGLMIWIGIEAFDPSWTAQVAKGQWLVNAPVWIRSWLRDNAAVGCVPRHAGARLSRRQRIWRVFSRLPRLVVLEAVCVCGWELRANDRQTFPSLHARIAAISCLTPMMFMTRVRL